MFSDVHLQELKGILERRQDPAVPAQVYEDMLRMVETEQDIRRGARQRQKTHRARKEALSAPLIPVDPFNDPSSW